MSAVINELEVTELRRRLEEAEETLRAIRSGELDSLVVASNDGERVYTLQGADHPYRVLIEAMHQGAASLGSDGTILYCNRRLVEMLQRPAEKIVSSSVFDFLVDGDHPSLSALLTCADQPCQGELMLERPDGSLLPVLVALAPLPLSDTASIALVATDLTEQKAHADLQEASRLKDEFLAMLAHELRNPLGPIVTSVEIVHQLAVGQDDLLHAADVIERQARHMARLVDDLLDVSRITQGKVKLQLERVDLGELITRVADISRPSIHARKHHLTVALSEEPIFMDGDPTRLAQILSNLLGNAAKYTEEGGEIWLDASRAGETTVIKVRDNGTGIAPELLPHVFDLFIQGDRSLARSEGGLGIGLTLVRRLVELHGGTVSAVSAGAGTGSEFTVILPVLAQAPAAVADVEPIAVKEELPRYAILVVDDNKDGADSLALFLRLMGHHVAVAYDGMAAVSVAVFHQPEMILLDIGLPGISGYEVAKRLREQDPTGGTILVAMTGYGQEEDKKRSREAGFDFHLVKPVAPTVFKQMLASPELAAAAAKRLQARDNGVTQ